ncbi:acetyl-CoA synthetase-like protein [Nemania sp. NC0429]|nr:acetyl-CoA synthetase-like protein [Nemania sp. NC0429]
MSPHSNGRGPRPENGQEHASGGLLQRFDKWVALNPDRCAILFKDEEVSYGELNKRSLRLATKLKYHGVGLESIVPFCLQKSVRAIVSLLAILRCGAAFAAILPTAPRQRKKEIIEACRSKVVICGPDEKSLTEGLCEDQIVVSEEMPDEEEELAEKSKSTTSFAIPSNSNAACVLFTSGSTGNVSIVETIVTLARGACICMPTEEERLEGTEAFVNRTGANWAFFTPSVARTLNPTQMAGLKTVVLGGEGTSKDIVRRWWQGRRLINSYGPCESTIWFSFAEVLNEEADVRNVGIPIRDYNKGHIVSPDDSNILMPDQDIVTGELLIEGPNVVRGYLNDEARSSAAFIQPPTWYNNAGVEDHDRDRGEPRLYLTGDLVERCKDGSFRIIGRKDRQVKIRGQKVDLNEIRHHFLSNTTTVQDFVAIFEGFSTTQKQRRHELVGFVVAHSRSARSGDATIAAMTEELRADLRSACEALHDTIPGFLVPTLFIPVTHIPLNVHSKVDVSKLSSILASLSDSQERLFSLYQATFEPLTTEDELILGEAVSLEIGLNINDINANEGFIQLGGDSLKAMSVVANVRRRGKHLSMNHIMTSQTLRSMALFMTALEPSQLEGIIPAPFSLLQPGTDPTIRSQASEACGVPEEAIHDAFPCSALQEGFIGVSSRDPRANVARYMFKLGPSIDNNRLRGAWHKTTSTIQALRTRFFVSASQGLLQVIVDAPIVVSSHESLEEYLQLDTTRPFKSGDPMARLCLATHDIDGVEKRYLVLTIHHAILDLFTLRKVVETFRAAYKSEPLPPNLPFQVAISERRDTTTIVENQRFWKSALEHSPTSFWPPQTSITSLTAQTQWERCVRRIEMSRLSHKMNNHTLSTYIQAAWALLVGTYQADDDVLIGLVVSGRESSRCDPSHIAGPMLATCPLRLTFSREATIAEFLQLTQQKVMETSRYAHFGLQHISRLGNDEKRGSSLQTLLVVQPDVDPTETPDVDMELDEVLTQQESLGSYPCWVECVPRGNQLKIFMEYVPQAIGSGEVVLDNLIHTLCALVDGHPGDTISSLPLLPIAETSKVSHPRHEAVMDVRQETVHDYILNIARNNPEKEAVVSWDGSFTYRQLDQLSERMALQLRRAGVEVSTFVPVCAQKSIWVVIGLLAILRAGGVYVPLDINSPPARHQEILGQFQPPVVLVSPGDERSWPASVNDSSAPEQKASLPLVPSDSVAYCFFTSGTTGSPKGVLIEHNAHLTSALARLAQFERNASSRVLQISSYAYDLSVEDICTTFMAGGTLVMPSEDERLNDIVGAINRYAVNNVNVTPSLASLLHPEKVPSLEVLVIGGEVPSSTLYDTWTSSQTHLINAYGPTECCNWSTVTRAIPQDTRNIGWMTCGRAWVTHPEDPHVRMPPGAVGELLLEGPMLARGYLQNLQATSQAFVTDLRWAQPGSRFYRTGDLVRPNHDGSFTFVRRRDHQVKFNGIRIELAEIESKIISAGAGTLKDACVEAVKLEGRQTLVAFCVPVMASPPEQWQSIVGLLVEKLHTLLPLSLIPAIIIPLDALPTTLSGKRDRRQLRRTVENATTDEIRNHRISHLNPPRLNQSPFSRHENPSAGSFEAAMVKSWIEVLGLPEGVKVTSTSNFFELGGDSVIAMRLVALCRERNMSISVPDIYQWPILRDLARVPDSISSTKVPTAIVSLPDPFSMLGSWKQHSSVFSALHEQLPDTEIEDVYPCTTFQEGIMALSVLQPGSYVAKHRFRLSASVGINLSELNRACYEVIAANPILRTRILYVDGFGFYQVVLSPVKSDEPAMLSSNQDILVRPWEPCSPLSQIEILVEGETEIVCYASHAVFDAFTWDLICKQINMAYYSKLEPSAVIPYGAFVAHVNKADDTKSRKFWSEQLDGAQPTNLFATSQKRVEKSQIFEINIHVPSHGSFEDITDATRLHAAWSIVVSQFTSSNDVVFGSVLSERSLDIPGIDKVMGPCVATVPIRLQLQREASIRDILRALQRQLIDTVSHAHFGLTKIATINEAASKFDSLLTVFPAPAGSESIHGLPGESVVIPFSSNPAYESETGYYSHSLVLEVQPTKSKLSVQAIFDSSVASQFLVDSLVHCLCYTYEQLSRIDNHATIADIDLCSPRDRQKILSWNLAGLPSSCSLAGSTIPELISLWAQRNPQKTAIEAWDGNLTFEDIDRYSSRLAVYLQVHFPTLRDIEVTPICFSRSLWVPVVMLAIQKMGKAYTALDPAFPTQRLSQLAKQLGADIIITDAEQGNRFKVETLVVNRAFIENLPLTQEQSLDPINPEDPAVVLFTSGSTGVPKTILIQQKAVVSAITGFGSGMDFSPETRTLQNAAFAFDIHACEIFLTLAHGGCLVISDADQSQLANTVRMYNVNWLFMTPSTMHLLSGPEEIPSVKTLMMIGEAPTKAIVENWGRQVSPGLESRLHSQLHLINAYGPAENTLFSTMHSIKSPKDDPTNIGKGINTLTWVVDPSNPDALVPVGCVGELILQGTQLAREYLSQPEETSKSFIAPPKWASTLGSNVLEAFGNRFYKTGDLVRYESDGTLRIVGRIDSQAKLNGQRLELSEVEHHVSQLIAESRIAAEIVEPRGGPRCLAVFVEGSESSPPSLSSSSSSTIVEDKQESDREDAVREEPVNPGLIRDFASCREKLRDYLPSFMVPALFIAVRKLPQTASNKLDRKALRAMVSHSTYEQLDTGRDYSSDKLQLSIPKQLPQTHAQEILRKLWAKVLGVSVQNIGIDDHFFRMGGDSIRAIRLATLMSAENPGDDPIPVAAVFENPLLRNMAIVLESDNNDLNPVAEVLAQPSLPSLELIQGTQREREEQLQYCATSLGLSVDSIQDIYPCTPLQEAMLAASALLPNAYVMEQKWDLGPFANISRLENAWRRTIHQLDILRTTFVSTPGLGTLQVVIKPAENLAVFQKQGAEDGNAKELTMLRLEPGEGGNSRLVWRAHHALFDQWTLMMVFDAVKREYRGEAQHDHTQFKSFIRHLTQSSTKHLTKSHGAYWDHYLKGAIPTPFPNKPGAPTASSKQHGRITLKTSMQAAHSVTAAIIARAAWSLVLSQYTNTDTVVFGTTLSGRNVPLAGIESVCGPTITTVPVRVHVRKDEAVGAFLQSLQDEAVAMMPHEHHGLQNIRQISDEIHDLCEFQNLLVVQPAWATEEEKDAIMQPIENQSATSEYHTLPLVIEYSLDGDNSMLEAHFDQDVISPVQMMRILRQIEQVALQLQKLNPESPINEIDFLSSSDRREVDEWNKSKPELLNEFIDEVISQQAALRPTAQAICAHDGNLTYAQFEAESNRLAKILTDEYDIGTGDIIPLCFEKSLWAMVAMLAVLKTGAAFVPTDPAQSVGRLNEIIHQIQPKAILVSEQTCRYAFSTKATRVIVDGKTRDRIKALATPLGVAKQAMHTTRPPRHPSDLAYIIFTSGSTGKPKGVMIQHNSYRTSARPRRFVLARSETARVIQFATYSFDTSIEDTLTTWGYGACVCIPSEFERLNDLEGVMNRMRITCAHLTPSLASALTPANVPTLRQLHFGGEKMTGSALRRWAESGVVDVRNVYGPTESSISTTITSRLSPNADPSNIGFAVGCNVWITDIRDHDRLAPVGCVGELLIEGHVLAKGYFKNPEKTAEAFIVDPKWAKNASMRRGWEKGPRRFYKTGDVAKYADDGSIVCLGRKDAQVKLNGNRIEIGDVETNLRHILDGSIDELAVEVVVPKKNNPSLTPLLVVFIAIESSLPVKSDPDVQDSGDGGIPGVLDDPAARSILNAILGRSRAIERMEAIVPSYMVPTAFVPLRTIPKSIAKKTDRNALQRLVSHFDAQELRSFFDQDISTPTNTATTTLGTDLIQELCSIVLGQEKDKIKTSNSFIKLGGDSILALRLVAAARRRGFNGLTVADTLRAKSLNGLAKFYQHRDDVTHDIQRAEITISGGAQTSLVEEVSLQLLVSPEDIEVVQHATGFEQEAFEASMLPEHGYMNSFSFAFVGPVHLHRLEHACERLVARHGALRTVFVDHRGILYHVTLRHRLCDEPRLRYFAETSLEANGVVPETGYGKPLIQFSVLQKGQKTELVICLSHALYDGMSFAILCHDLSRAYLGLPLGHPAPQFPSFFTEMSPGNRLDTQQFWRTLLRGSKMTDLTAISNRHKKVRSKTRNIEDSEVSTRFRCPSSGNSSGFTFASLLKAAWAAVLARNSGTSDVVFGHVVSTRSLVNSSTEGLVGPCLEFVPVRVMVEEHKGNASAARNLLERVQSQQIEGMPHHGYGFRNIVRQCTDWPSSTRMHTFVQHRGLEEAPVELVLQDGVAATVDVEARTFGLCDLWVVTTSLGGGEVDVTMSYCGHVFNEDMVRMLLHELVAEIHGLRYLLEDDE